MSLEIVSDTFNEEGEDHVLPCALTPAIHSDTRDLSIDKPGAEGSGDEVINGIKDGIISLICE